MVFLTALCYYNGLPGKFNVLEDVTLDSRTFDSVVREWAPFHSELTNINYDCHVLVNGEGYLPVKDSLKSGTIENFSRKLQKRFAFTGEQDFYSIFLRINYASRLDTHGSRTRDHY